MADNVRRYTIPEVPISINRFIGRDNKWAYYAEKTRWRELCAVYCRPRPDHPPEFAHLKIQFFFQTNVGMIRTTTKRHCWMGWCIAG